MGIAHRAVQDARRLQHALSFDIECYYQITWKDYIQRRRDPTAEAEVNTHYLLDLLADRGVRPTFFVLGNIARHYPQLVRRIVDEGHELGVHGDVHLYIHQLTPEAFARELARGVDSLEQVAGCKVLGHRAPAFSIGTGNLWALDVLQEAGLVYDSSIFPFQGRRYGIAGAPLEGYRHANGLFEFPMTVIEQAGRRFPAAGGGYFRLFPYRYTRWAMDRCEREGRPAITYFHPHEFSLDPPRTELEAWASRPLGAARLALSSAIQGTGRGKPMRQRLAQLLREYRFVPMRELLPS